MSFEKMNLKVEQIREFQPHYSESPVTGVIGLSGGEWSQAFAFKQGGKDYVLRLSESEDDFLIDSFANRFSTIRLPIPKIVELGAAFGGYYAVSERAFGVMIDDLDKASMKRIIPSLFETLDAIRVADISGTNGFGILDVNGNGVNQSWNEFLHSVADDAPNRKVHGWREGLKSSPLGDEPFNRAYAKLVELSRDLPEVRSLMHNDLMHFNVLTNDDKINAVFDWANASYGDFLYELASIAFWGPLYEPIKEIDWIAEAESHFKEIGLEVPQFEKRLQCYMIRVGLDAQSYYGFKRNWDWLKPVVDRTMEIAK
ncbi:aminoglycoside phosphotransferase family protein [Candidatus Saccharibacteria bacterium]|nr:MAG: aminoglycoside phosphotransferase family protein [Candidatus Saccharibacteria bacterium]